MKNLIALLISGALVVSGYSQTRNVLVGTNNAVVQPTNFWSADASNARAGLGLGTAATNPATAFQPSSSVLTNLASSNAVNLTNLRATNIVGVIASSNIPTVSLTNISGTLAIVSGGTGATNAGGARTNLGLGATNNVAFNSVTTELLNYGTNYIISLANQELYADGNSVLAWNTNEIEINAPILFGTSNAISTTRTNLGLGATWLTNTVASNFRTAIGLGAFQSVVFSEVIASTALEAGSSTNTVIIDGDGINFGHSGIASTTRTNLGLGWSGLTNTTASGFQTALFGTNTNPVLVNTNGEVVSPTNFWQAAPINTLVQYSQPTGSSNSVTNAATNARNLYLYSLTPLVNGVTNTITLPTNAATFNGDVATVIHEGPTNSVTAIRQIGSATNIISLNQFQEAVQFIRNGGGWKLADNISQVEALYFSGTNAAIHAAESRTNLGLGGSDDVLFSSVSAGQFEAGSGTNTVSVEGTGIVFGGNSSATTRTNLGLGATNVVTFLSLITANTNGSLINLDPAETLGQFLTGIGKTSNSIYFTYASFTYLEANTNGWTVHKPFSFSSDVIRLETLTNLQLASTNIVTFAGITNNGDITINQTTATNGLLFIRRTNNEAFLGMANLIASNNTTINNETLFRVGVAEATNRSAQFGFRSTNTNGNGVAVFSVFGYNALMMIGPSDPAAGTNPIEATVYSVSPTNKVMTLIKTNTGATMFHRPVEFENTTNQAVTRTNLGLPLSALTNTTTASFQRAVFQTNTTPASGANLGDAKAWLEISVVTNNVTNSFRIPAFQ